MLANPNPGGPEQLALAEQIYARTGSRDRLLSDENWVVVPKPWLASWQAYCRAETAEEPLVCLCGDLLAQDPLPANQVYSDGFKRLNPALRLGVDFELIPEALYIQLNRFYGVSPKILRFVDTTTGTDGNKYRLRLKLHGLALTLPEAAQNPLVTLYVAEWSTVDDVYKLVEQQIQRSTSRHLDTLNRTLYSMPDTKSKERVAWERGRGTALRLAALVNCSEATTTVLYARASPVVPQVRTRNLLPLPQTITPTMKTVTAATKVASLPTSLIRANAIDVSSSDDEPLSYNRPRHNPVTISHMETDEDDSDLANMMGNNFSDNELFAYEDGYSDGDLVQDGYDYMSASRNFGDNPSVIPSIRVEETKELEEKHEENIWTTKKRALPPGFTASSLSEDRGLSVSNRFLQGHKQSKTTDMLQLYPDNNSISSVKDFRSGRPISRRGTFGSRRTTGMVREPRGVRYGSNSNSSSSSSNSTSSSYRGYNATSHRVQLEPGVVGLSNLGNTCFMNSSIQCLLRCEPLTEAILTGAYEADVNTTNTLGAQGELIKVYAQLVKEAYTSGQGSLKPNVLKGAIGKFAPRFRGYQQHDSQELIAFLLDGLHEDLNKIAVKKYTQLDYPPEMRDNERAQKSWANHLSRDNSVVVDNFHGQLKSHVTCPECDKTSITFDPTVFLTLSLTPKPTPPPPLPVEGVSVLIRYVPFDSRQPAVIVPVKVTPTMTTGQLNMHMVNQLNEEAKKKTPGSPLLNSKAMFPYDDNVSFVPGRTVNRQTHGMNEVFKHEQLALMQETDIFLCFNELPNARATPRLAVRAWVSDNLEALSGFCTDPKIFCQKVNSQAMFLQLQVTFRKFVNDFAKEVHKEEEQQQDGGLNVLAQASSTVLNDRYTPPPQYGNKNYSGYNTSNSTSGFDMLNYGKNSAYNAPYSPWDTCNCAETAFHLTCHTDHTKQKLAVLRLLQRSLRKCLPATLYVPVVAAVDEKGSAMFPQFVRVTAGTTTYGELQAAVRACVPRWLSTSIGSVNPRDTPVTFPTLRDSFIEWNPRAKVSTVPEVSDDPNAIVTLKHLEQWLSYDMEQTIGVCNPISIDLSKLRQNPQFELPMSQAMQSGQRAVEMEFEAKRKLHAQTHRRLTLDALLENFTSGEQLSAANAWYCSDCKKHQEAYKMIDIWNLSNILVVHLKRFKENARGTGKVKIKSVVDFPLEGLDMTRFVKGPKDKNLIYDLIAVSNHLGTMQFGHYTAYGKSHKTSKWFELDDSSTTEINTDRLKQTIVSKDAYVLFYQRRKDGEQRSQSAPAQKQRATSSGIA